MPDRMKVDRDEHGRLYYEYTVYDSDDVDGRKGTNKVGRTVRLQPHDVQTQVESKKTSSELSEHPNL